MLYRVIGVMSGSSLDGLDLAYVEFEEKGGKWTFSVVASACYSYDEAWTIKLKTGRDLKAVDFVSLDAEYGHYVGAQINRFIQENGLDYKVGLIASHGHTLFHLPGKYSVQIGNGAAIAATTSLPVVSDLRSLDVALGGQGAPIVPMGEQLLFSDYTFFLNIGGISNISFKGEQLYDAFDVCPANRVLNTLAEELGFAYDENGENARKGNLVEGLLDQLNAQEYYWQTFPKSLANEFGTDVIIPLIKSFKLDIRDALCTYVEHIAMQVSESVQQINRKRGVIPTDEKILVTGGGAFNVFLVERLNHHLHASNLTVEVPDPQTVAFKEAIIMGLLGILRWREEPTVLKTVTGAREQSIGGALWMGKS